MSEGLSARVPAIQRTAKLRFREVGRDVGEPGSEGLDRLQASFPVDVVEGPSVVAAEAGQRIAAESQAIFRPRGLQGVDEGLAAGGVADEPRVVAEWEVITVDPQPLDDRRVVRCSQ